MKKQGYYNFNSNDQLYLRGFCCLLDRCAAWYCLAAATDSASFAAVLASSASLRAASRAALAAAECCA